MSQASLQCKFRSILKSLIGRYAIIRGEENTSFYILKLNDLYVVCLFVVCLFVCSELIEELVRATHFKFGMCM